MRCFPNRSAPHASVFNTSYRHLSETGNLRKAENVRPSANVDAEDENLHSIDENKTCRTRQIAHEVGVSPRKVWTTLNCIGQHPLHYTSVQGLVEDDPAERVAFCRILLNADTEHSRFLSKLIDFSFKSDESKFNTETFTKSSLKGQ